jgi:hypothetical protein
MNGRITKVEKDEHSHAAFRKDRYLYWENAVRLLR